LIDGVVDSVTSEEIKFDYKGRPDWGVDLDKLLPLGPQLVATGTDVLDGAIRDILTLHPDSRNNVALQHLLQLFFVRHQLVE